MGLLKHQNLHTQYIYRELTMTEMCARLNQDVEQLDLPFAVALGKQDPTLQARKIRNSMVRSKTARGKQWFKEFDCCQYLLLDENFPRIVDYFCEHMREMR